MANSLGCNTAYSSIRHQCLCIVSGVYIQANTAEAGPRSELNHPCNKFISLIPITHWLVEPTSSHTHTHTHIEHRTLTHSLGINLRDCTTVQTKVENVHSHRFFPSQHRSFAILPTSATQHIFLNGIGCMFLNRPTITYRRIFAVWCTRSTVHATHPQSLLVARCRRWWDNIAVQNYTVPARFVCRRA